MLPPDDGDEKFSIRWRMTGEKAGWEKEM